MQWEGVFNNVTSFFSEHSYNLLTCKNPSYAARTIMIITIIIIITSLFSTSKRGTAPARRNRLAIIKIDNTAFAMVPIAIGENLITNLNSEQLHQWCENQHLKL